MEMIWADSGWATLRFAAFDTENRIVVPEHHRDVLPQCLLLSRRLHQLWSPGAAGSDVSRLNRGGGWVEVHPKTVTLIQRAVETARISRGRFDPAIGWATRIWRFKEPRDRLPEKEALQRPEQGWQSLRWEEKRIFIPPQVKLDLGGIAKGAIADELTRLLRARGVDRALLDLGGNIAVLGCRTEEKPWRIGLRHPEKGREDYFAVFSGRDCSVVTSAASERYVQAEGMRCGHLLDSSSGWSAETDLISATVIAPESVAADALSTACYVAGRAAAAEILRACPQVQAALLDRAGCLWLTDGLYGAEQQLEVQPGIVRCPL